MFNRMLICLVPLSALALITPAQGFWWRSTTTEAPPTPPLMKQIPLTYFRTYTYQPMAGNPLPFPLMSSTDYITNYAALSNNPYFNPMMSLLGGGGGGIAVAANNNEIGSSPQAVMGGARPSKSYTGVRSINNGPQIAAPKKTTTTTTTTRKPTTTKATTTTTSTTAASTTSTSTTLRTTNEGGPPATSTPLIKADSMVNIEAAYPAFNRKVYTNHFNINYNRPVYPYPEYSIYKPSNAQINSINEEKSSAPSTQTPAPVPAPAPPNVEFVPCMCPVNIQSGYPSGLPIAGNPSNSIFLAQGRTNPDVEAGIDLPLSESVDSSNAGDLITEEVPLTNFVDDLQIVNMDGDEDGVTPSLSAS